MAKNAVAKTNQKQGLVAVLQGTTPEDFEVRCLGISRVADEAFELMGRAVFGLEGEARQAGYDICRQKVLDPILAALTQSRDIPFIRRWAEGELESLGYFGGNLSQRVWEEQVADYGKPKPNKLFAPEFLQQIYEACERATVCIARLEAFVFGGDVGATITPSRLDSFTDAQIEQLKNHEREGHIKRDELLGKKGPVGFRYVDICRYTWAKAYNACLADINISHADAPNEAAPTKENLRRFMNETKTLIGFGLPHHEEVVVLRAATFLSGDERLNDLLERAVTRFQNIEDFRKTNAYFGPRQGSLVSSIYKLGGRPVNRRAARVVFDSSGKLALE